MDKKYCYIATHRISVDSNLNTLYVLDDLQNIEEPISVFEKGKYKLLVKIGENQKVDSLIYTSEYQEDLHIHFYDFKREAIVVLNKAINRLQTAFGLVKIYKQHSIKIQKDPEINIECFNYESKTTYQLLGGIGIEAPYGYCSLSNYVYINLQDIKNILEIDKENIDEYINRFVSLENLSSDPVLHLINLWTLYEYIEKNNDIEQYAEFNIEIVGKSIELNGRFEGFTVLDKFKSTRHFVAHGSLTRPKTLGILKLFLSINSSDNLPLFDRYNQSHINLINEVIGEAQPIIQQYLRGKLGLKK